MITLGVILLLLGLFVFHPLLIVGIVLLVLGLCLGGFGYAGHAIGPRRHYW